MVAHEQEVSKKQQGEKGRELFHPLRLADRRESGARCGSLQEWDRRARSDVSKPRQALNSGGLDVFEPYLALRNVSISPTSTFQALPFAIFAFMRRAR